MNDASSRSHCVVDLEGFVTVHFPCPILLQMLTGKTRRLIVSQASDHTNISHPVVCTYVIYTIFKSCITFLDQGDGSYFCWLILPFEVFTICLHCQDTSDSSRPSVGRCQVPNSSWNVGLAAQIPVKSAKLSKNFKTCFWLFGNCLYPIISLISTQLKLQPQVLAWWFGGSKHNR